VSATITDASDRFPARRHRWPDESERRIPACESPDGNDRTEKTCQHCGMVKVTIHYPHGRIPGREWRRSNGAVIKIEHTPPCTGMKEGVW
jgi:hypothetical protein